jgi:hypothetical protein
MANFRFVAIIIGTFIIASITVNVLIFYDLENVVFLIIAGGLLAAITLVFLASRFSNVYSNGGENQAPDSLKNKLDPEEAIISRLTGQQDVDWYLTNKHLIRIQRNEEEPVKQLPTQDLTVHYKTKINSRRTTLWVTSSLLTGIGVLMVILAYFVSINYTGMPQSAALSFDALGFAALIFAFILSVNTVSYYQFMHPSMEEADPDKKFWRIRETSKNKEPIKQFLSDIERLSQNPSSPAE